MRIKTSLTERSVKNAGTANGPTRGAQMPEAVDDVRVAAQRSAICCEKSIPFQLHSCTGGGAGILALEWSTKHRHATHFDVNQIGFG